MACHPWRPPFGASLGDVKNGSRPFFATALPPLTAVNGDDWMTVLYVDISNRDALKDAALAQTALSARQTMGSTILLA